MKSNLTCFFRWLDQSYQTGPRKKVLEILSHDQVTNAIVDAPDDGDDTHGL